MNRIVAVLAVLALTALAACGGGDTETAADSAPGSAAGSDTPASSDAGASADGASGALAEARAYYSTECARCHGARGRGDGPMGKAINPGPRDYSDPSWQESVTDEYLAKVILEGGRAHGLNPMMPASPDLAERPEVLDALVQHIRSFAQ